VISSVPCSPAPARRGDHRARESSGHAVPASRAATALTNHLTIQTI
jgi:hypothetical protein